MCFICDSMSDFTGSTSLYHSLNVFTKVPEKAFPDSRLITATNLNTRLNPKMLTRDDKTDAQQLSPCGSKLKAGETSAQGYIFRLTYLICFQKASALLLKLG